MGYEPSDKPHTFFLVLLAGLILITLGYLLVRLDHASAFTKDLHRCAGEHGIGELEWRTMHGFHDFNIGREFRAKTPAERNALSCALENTSAELVTRDAEQGDQYPALRIWYGETLFERDIVVYTPPSN